MEQTVFKQLSFLQQIKKFPEFYATRQFITVYTTAHHLPPSNKLQFSFQPPSHLALFPSGTAIPSMPKSSKWIFRSEFITRSLYALVFFTIRATCPAHLVLLHLVTLMIFVWSPSLCNWQTVCLYFLFIPCLLHLLFWYNLVINL